jgi:hypothetical protein
MEGRKWHSFVPLVFVLALVAAACGEETSSEPADGRRMGSNAVTVEFDDSGVYSAAVGDCVVDSLTQASLALYQPGANSSDPTFDLLESSPLPVDVFGNDLEDTYRLLVPSEAPVELAHVRAGTADGLQKLDERALTVVTRDIERFMKALRERTGPHDGMYILGRHNVAGQVIFKGVVRFEGDAVLAFDKCNEVWIDVSDEFGLARTQLGAPSNAKMMEVLLDDPESEFSESFARLWAAAGLDVRPP